MKDLLCIYHGNCADGFGAAWAVHQAFGDAVEFHPGVYQQDPPDVEHRDVIMVDFSYKRDVILSMAHPDIGKARSIVIVDHHKSAAEDLAGFLRPDNIYHCWEQATYWDDNDGPCIWALFDMERSGAGLAWDFFCEGPRPPLIDHIEDRDLWRFALPGTREIQAAVFSYPYEFDVWHDLMRRDPEELRAEGAVIERKHFKDIRELLRVCQRSMNIHGHNVPVASLPYTLTSDAGHIMCEETDAPFAACYWDTADTRIFSLRSTDNGADVSEIAVAYGGGGHKHAAGFAVPRSHELARA